MGSWRDSFKEHWEPNPPWRGRFTPCRQHGPRYDTMVCLPCEIDRLREEIQALRAQREAQAAYSMMIEQDEAPH